MVPDTTDGMTTTYCSDCPRRSDLTASRTICCLVAVYDAKTDGHADEEMIFHRAIVVDEVRPHWPPNRHERRRQAALARRRQ